MVAEDTGPRALPARCGRHLLLHREATSFYQSDSGKGDRRDGPGQVGWTTGVTKWTCQVQGWQTRRE